ncbi:MAG: Rid family detoxifying hydrolase [Ginsengibacter sp.]
MNKQIIKTDKAPSPIGPYNQAISANGLLFISGQVALIPGSNEMRMDNITTETEQVMDNLKSILTEAGLTFENVVKTTIFLKDMSFFSEVNASYGSHFTDKFPARETIAVKGLPKDVNVEISMIACY